MGGGFLSFIERENSRVGYALRANELDKQQAIVVICHHGMRSQQAALYLEHAGFNNLANLHGGIDAWSVYCEPSMPRY